MTLDWPLSVLVGDVWKVPERCLGGVLGCLSDSGYCLGWGGWGRGYDVKLIDENLIRVILISWFLLSQVPQNAWRVSGKCLRGVWGLCEWLWILSDRYDVQAIDKHPIRLIFISWLLFCQLPWIGQNVLYFGVSEGCLEGVWEVSGGCVSDSGYCLGGMMCKQLINT